MSAPTANKSFSDGVQHAWDATSLKAFIECPRKYLYSIVLGWRGLNNDHLIFGKAYASALEEFYKLLAEGQPREEALLTTVHNALIRVADWESRDSNKNPHTLIRSIVWYADEFAFDPTEVIILETGAPACELSFSIPLNDEVLWCGHIDRLVTYNDEVFVMDQKSTKAALTAYYFNQFSPDVQFTGYIFAAKAGWAAPTRGAIIDAAQIMVGFTRFSRGFLHRTDEQLQEWHDETLRWINLAREWSADKHYPMNTTSCGNYGGCPYRTVCSKNPDLRGVFLKGDFEQQPGWDPLERR